MDVLALTCHHPVVSHSTLIRHWLRAISVSCEVKAAFGSGSISTSWIGSIRVELESGY